MSHDLDICRHRIMKVKSLTFFFFHRIYKRNHLLIGHQRFVQRIHPQHLPPLFSGATKCSRRRANARKNVNRCATMQLVHWYNPPPTPLHVTHRIYTVSRNKTCKRVFRKNEYLDEICVQFYGFHRTT